MLEPMLNDKMPIVKKFANLMAQALGSANQGFLSRCAGSPRAQFGNLLGQGAPQLGQSPQNIFGDFLNHMEFTNLMLGLGPNLTKGLWIKRGAIGGDAQYRKPSGCQHFIEPLEELFNILVGWIFIQNFIGQAPLTLAVNGKENTEGPVIDFIGGQIAREPIEGPGLVVRPKPGDSFFFPLPRSSFESWQKGQTPGGPSRGARKRFDKPGSLPARAAEPWR